MDSYFSGGCRGAQVGNLRSGLWGNMAGLVVNIEPFVIDGFVNGGLMDILSDEISAMN